MYLYTENEKMYFNLNTTEKAVLAKIINNAFKIQRFYENDEEHSIFYRAVDILKDCYFLDFMDYTTYGITWAVHTVIDEYFSAVNYQGISNHPLYKFFCEIDRFLTLFIGE